jgi:ABC-type sugar transport system permease subunit
MFSSRMARREALLFYLCISPWLLGFLLFTLGPVLASLAIQLYALGSPLAGRTHWPAQLRAYAR